MILDETNQKVPASRAQSNDFSHRLHDFPALQVGFAIQIGRLSNGGEPCAFRVQP
jgi:hypothetical protein